MTAPSRTVVAALIALMLPQSGRRALAVQVCAAST